MKLFISFCLPLFIAITSVGQYTDISGTWYQNGNSSAPAYIIQNGANLTIFVGSNSSTASFTSSSQVYAATWKAYATVSSDGNTIKWTDQTWTRADFSYPSIAGSWTVNGSTITITQNGRYLEFIMPNGRSKGYFYAANAIYASDWNTYASYDPNTKSLKWTNQTWTASSNVSGTNTSGTSNTGATGNGKVCRKELSMFFYAMDALGTTWARPVYEPGMMSARTIEDLRAAFSIITPTLNLFPCIVFDRNRITNLSASLNSITGAQASRASEQIIHDLQLAVRNAAITCDKNFNLEQLFIAGVNLGAAQAHASSRMCQPVPMPMALQSTISAHLSAAATALSTLTACMPELNLAAFATVPLGSMNSTEPHTFIVGLITETLWAVTLTNCCCTCGGSTTGTTGGTNCDQECDKWCKQQGKNGGKFNGICLLGVMSGGTQPDCQCW
jgi:hypothetical protein